MTPIPKVFVSFEAVFRHPRTSSTHTILFKIFVDHSQSVEAIIAKEIQVFLQSGEYTLIYQTEPECCQAYVAGDFRTLAQQMVPAHLLRK